MHSSWPPLTRWLLVGFASSCFLLALLLAFTPLSTSFWTTDERVLDVIEADTWLELEPRELRVRDDASALSLEQVCLHDQDDEDDEVAYGAAGVLSGQGRSRGSGSGSGSGSGLPSSSSVVFAAPRLGTLGPSDSNLEQVPPQRLLLRQVRLSLFWAQIGESPRLVIG
jgi:hypothetical protein